MPIDWTLKELLEHHGLSVYALAEHMGGAAGGASKRPGLYAITSSDPSKRPSRVSFDLLSELLTALNELTGMAHDIQDVLRFTPDLRPNHDGLLFGGELDDLVDLLGMLREDATTVSLMDAPVDTQTEVRRKRGRPKGSRNRRKPIETQ